MTSIATPFEPADWALADFPTCLQRPDRRWVLVSRHVQETIDSGVQPSICDPFVKQAFDAVLGRRYHRAGRSQTNRNNPDLHAAIQLGQTPSNVADLVRAYLLVRQSPAEVAEILGLRAEVVQWYTRLYFDVCDRLDACDWISVHVLDVAECAIGETELGSPEYEIARDRFVLFRAAYTGGIGILKRIVRPIAKPYLEPSVSPLNGSPLCRILTWVWTVETSLPVCVQVLDRLNRLLGNSTLNDEELNCRLEILADYVEHREKRKSRGKKNTRSDSNTSETSNHAKADERSTAQDAVDESKPSDPLAPGSESTAA